MTVLRSGSATDVGRMRKVNEDYALEADNLFAVADGMGGHVGGEVASRVAVEALQREFSREPTAVGLGQAFSRANAAVWQQSQDRPDLRGMGTSLTAAALVGDTEGHDILALANVGDSRAYVLSGGRLVQVTADHSLAEERMRHGEMTRAEAAVHPQRHILTRALGVGPDVAIDMWSLRLRSGDRVVLCSDGLSNELATTEMTDVLTSVADPAEAAYRLVEEANAHGGADNITVVVVDVLVGEDEAQGSVVTPISDGLGPPLVLVGREQGGGVDDRLEPETQTRVEPVDALTGVVTLPPRDGRGAALAASGPVARAAARVGAPERAPRERAVAPVKESRRARRRRLGVPRRVTLRVFLFVILLAGILAAVFAVVRWYAYDDWYVTVKGGQVVVERGRPPSGVLWFKPTLAARTGVKTTQLLPPDLTKVRGDVQEASLAEATHYVDNLHSEYVFLKEEAAQEAKARKAAEAATTTTTTTPPAQRSNVETTTTVPPTTTSTTAAAAAVPVTTTTTSTP